MLSKLWQIAQKQAGILQDRDEVIGVGLYGSLSYSQVTPFSDLDIFIITTESEHSPDIDHRVIDGVRADFIWHTFEQWQKIQYNEPRYMPWYTAKSLLLGKENLILYDPENVIRKKFDQLREETTYEMFVAPETVGKLDWIGERLMIVIWHAEEGNFSRAWHGVNGWATGWLFEILCEHTNCKRVEEAARAVGLPQLLEHIETIRCVKSAVDGSTPAYVRKRLELDKAHWEYQLESMWQPLREHLIAQGVESPEKLEVIGELILPYGGERVYELERVFVEHSFSLEWAQAELEHGDVQEAIRKIRYEDIIDMANEKWRRVDDAITAAGYDTGMIIKNFLASEEFQNRTEEARKAQNSSDAIPVTAEHTHELITAIYEYTRLLNEYILSHYPDMVEGMPELYSMSRAEIVQRCRDRETRIDNDTVSIVVSKERAAVQSLVFKPGSNNDLIETYWFDACLLDLSSTSHHDLRKKWTLEEEVQSANETHFVFSQDGGYRVVLDISWSQIGIAVEHHFVLPCPIAINNNMAIGGRRWPKPRNDHWAITIDGKVETGDYDYKPGPHIFLYPTDGSYFTPGGCWIAAWNEDVDEICGFTFSSNCGCIVARGAGTDFEFYLPAGESTLRFHVITPKPDPPYLALQQLACDEKPVPLGVDADGRKPRSPYADRG